MRQLQPVPGLSSTTLSHQVALCESVLRADFRERDEDSNFSVLRVRRFSEWPEPLH